VSVTVKPFRFWWLVEWTEEGELRQLLFKRHDMAYGYRDALVRGDQQAMQKLEKGRLAR